MRPDNSPSDQGQRSFIEDARRAQIISCAVDVLAESGYAGTSLARIAQRAGISKGVISYHFSGKDELLEQVVQELYTRGADATMSALRAETTAAGMLEASLRVNLGFIRDHAHHMTAAREVTRNLRSPDGTPRFDDDTKGAEPILAGLETIFRTGQDNGEFHDFDTRTMAWAVRSVIDGVNQRHATEPSMDFTTCVDEIVVLFHRATNKKAYRTPGENA